MIDYDSFSRCHLTDIFFRFSRGSKRVKIDQSETTKSQMFSTSLRLTVVVKM